MFRLDLVDLHSKRLVIVMPFQYEDKTVQLLSVLHMRAKCKANACGKSCKQWSYIQNG